MVDRDFYDYWCEPRYSRARRTNPRRRDYCRPVARAMATAGAPQVIAMVLGKHSSGKVAGGVVAFVQVALVAAALALIAEPRIQTEVIVDFSEPEGRR